jgi:hypothetical protein
MVRAKAHERPCAVVTEHHELMASSILCVSLAAPPSSACVQVSPRCEHAGCDRRALYGISHVFASHADADTPEQLKHSTEDRPALGSEEQDWAGGLRVGRRVRAGRTGAARSRALGARARFCSEHRTSGSRDESHSRCRWTGKRRGALMACSRRAVYGANGGRGGCALRL